MGKRTRVRTLHLCRDEGDAEKLRKLGLETISAWSIIKDEWLQDYVITFVLREWVPNDRSISERMSTW